MTTYYKYFNNKISLFFIILLLIIILQLLLIIKELNYIFILIFSPLINFNFNNYNILYDSMYSYVLKDEFLISNYIPILEINVPFYNTDFFYIKFIFNIMLIIIIPMLYIIIMYIYITYIYIIEFKHLLFKIALHSINYIIILLNTYLYIIPYIISNNIVNSRTIMYVEFDTLFEIKDYIQYIVLYIILCIIYTFINLYYINIKIHKQIYIFMVTAILFLFMFSNIIGFMLFLINILFIFILNRLIIYTIMQLYMIKLNSKIIKKY